MYVCVCVCVRVRVCTCVCVCVCTCVCDVCADGIRFEHVSEFKYLRCVLDEAGTDEGECSRKVAHQHLEKNHPGKNKNDSNCLKSR